MIATIFGLLGAALHPAEAAHFVDGDASTLVVFVDSNVDVDPFGNDRQDEQGDESVVHHHCSSIGVADTAPLVPAVLHNALTLVAGLHPPLRSRTGDPLLEPPLS